MQTQFFNNESRVRKPKASVELERRIKIKEKEIARKSKGGPLDFLSPYLDVSNKKETVTLNTTNLQEVKHLYNVQDEMGYFKNIVNLRRINDIRRINKFFEGVNDHLPKGGRFVGCVETKAMRKERILKKYPEGLNWIVYSADFVYKRVLPKLPYLKKLYFHMTKGRKRVLTSVETLGRLYSCGFRIVDLQQKDSLLYFIAEKVKDPDFNLKPSYGPFFKMRRFGKDGKYIYVYKLRTMHPYAEYLQEYIYERNKLCEGGKFNNDIRVTTLGKICRKFWLDELPMIINVLKGDLKLIGVRPLSSHYLSLYTPELQEKRLKVKPGLLPPFYADMPRTLQEIMDSELRYLESYKKNPFKTDLQYLLRICNNIIIKKARSK